MRRPESFTIPSPSGIRLAAAVHRPQGTPAAAVVVAHGMLSSKDSPKHVALCEAAALAGFEALRFDFRGRGESDGDPEDLTVSNEITDLGAAVEWLRRRSSRPIALVGSSLGGTVALLAAAATNTTALVTIAAPARLPTAARATWAGGGRPPVEGRMEVAPGVFIRSHFFADAARHDPIRAAVGIRCPWLIVHGADDPVVPVSDANDLAVANPAARLVVRPAAGHRFEPPHREWLVRHAISFLTGQLAG